MTTTVASAQVQLSPSVTGFAQKLRDELRTVQSGLGDVQVNIVPKIKASSYKAVERDLTRLARDRMVQFTASADTRVAADDFDLLIRERRTRVVADADTRVAADDLALLTRDRTVTIDTRVNGSPVASGVAAAAGNDSGALSALISLAPALAPVAAYLGSVALEATSAAVAVGVFGAAVIPQIKQFSALSAAETTASAAVRKYGATSQQAVAAQQAVSDTLNGMPPATQKAAGAFLVLKKDFTGWSDSLADFTMVPVTQGIAVLDSLLPKLNPLVIDTSTQFTRLTTLLAGGVNSGAFDGLMSRFTTFTNKVLTKGVDEVVHFARVLSEGKADGPVSEFMQYARQNGPLVRDTLENIARAVTAVIKGASEAGPGMLSMVNSVVKLVAALPPSFIGRALQLYTVFRLYKLASSGVTTLGGSLTRLSTSFTALRAASTAAGGGVAGAGAAIGTLSNETKVAGAVVAIAALALTLKHFSDEGKQAKISSDAMATGLKGLATGDAKSASSLIEQLTKDSANLHQSLGQKIKSNDSVWDIVTNSGAKTSAAKKDFKELGSTLADMVKAGDSDQAAAALKKLTAAGVKVPTKYLKDYKSALADTKFESDLAAQSQGLFGKQAQDVQKKLDSQKQSADGLRGAIQALNDVNRSAMDAQSDFEQAIDDATKAIKGHRNALHDVNGQLDLSTQAARDAYKPLGDLAAKTDAAAAAARDNGESWKTVNGIYEQGRTALIRSATQMGLTTAEAKRLADQILKTPDKTAQLKGNVQDLQAKINTAKAQIRAMPSSKTVALRADEAQLQNVIRDAQARINALTGKSIIIHATYTTSGTVYHEGGDYGTKRATGGILPGYTPGRDVHDFYSPTAGRLHLSGGEAVMRPEWTRAVGPAFINAMNALSRTRGVPGVRAAMGFKDGGILGERSRFSAGGVVGTSAQIADPVPSVDPRSIRIELAEPGAGQGQTNNYFDLHTTDMPTEEGILLALRKHAVLRRPALV